ncbi:MAG: PDZ domain-containing protein [bacterium]|nr:PDZ domain-containing protein [bacterium]
MHIAGIRIAIILLAVLPPLALANRESRRTPIVRAVESAVPATVNITTTQPVSQLVNPFFRGDPLFERFFNRYLTRNSRPEQHLGTGVIIAPPYVLTNEHVLAGSAHIRVTLSDNREFEAELIGSDPSSDLAVIRLVTDEQLPSPTIGDSDDVMIGETVIAIGNAFGLNHTVTTGVLSGENRSIRTGSREYHGFLQTDASINPGNSGGPLLNLDGELIGINTAILGEAEGIGFAIPINRARRIVDDLIYYGEVVPTWLGMRLQEMTPALRGALEHEGSTGVLVSYVFDQSPADRIGVRAGDILLEFDGTRLMSMRNYFEILSGLTPGDRANLKIERGDKTLNLKIKAVAFPEERAEELAEILLGVEVTELNQDLARRYGIPANVSGLVIRRVIPRSPAANSGLRPGDVILGINRDRIEDRVAFRRAVTKLRGRPQVLLTVKRGLRDGSVTLELS